MSRIALASMPESYAKVLSIVGNSDTHVESRGMAHRELVAQQFRLVNPYLSLATNVGRNLNVKIAWAEGMQLVAGEAYPELMSRVSRGNFDRFKDGEQFHGSYGPRIRPQIGRALERLSKDSGSRQAVVTIWDPLHDMQDRNDLPCTLSFQFLVRYGTLIMVTTMRSNDAYLGFPYDIFQFTLLQKTMANCLGIPAGTYYHNVGSFHLYESDIEAAANVVSRPVDEWDEIEGIQPLYRSENLSPMDAWEECRWYADQALKGNILSSQSNVSNPLFQAVQSLHG